MLLNAVLTAAIILSESIIAMEQHGTRATAGIREEFGEGTGMQKRVPSKQERLNEIKKRPQVIALMKREQFTFSDVEVVLGEDCHFVLTFNFTIAGFWKAYIGFEREIYLEHILFGALRELLTNDVDAD